MTILLVLIPVTLLFVIAGAIAFFWAVNHDQFDDMETPALQPLADGDSVDSRPGTANAGAAPTGEAPPR